MPHADGYLLTVDLGGSRRQQEVAGRARLPADLQLERMDSARALQLAVDLFAMLGHGVDTELGGRAADDLVPMPADLARKCLVGVGDDLIAYPRHDDAGQRHIEDGGEPAFAFAQQLLGPAALGDVFNDSHERFRLTMAWREA